ncbi:TPA: hypothetical protein HA235_00195 [Candidatus Woesearchaeota archaeon]|nr:hypothetical protein [Candidatus Woesearchaeota archaeon]HIH31105.1 hypothetical protein [Candidatus Woesearchaeota archaeon]HIH55613.1 hypothetical protein [Candidatus Woesearchaeota archaeon]HIJ01198.1 hypothetical protein [Candidatus Woesearchaeota archaeon]HIJ14480.1 hypothetical protein [Candidatus Woesearchaeota archaeon]
MIGNKLEQDIIKVFEENLTETFSINSISKRLKKSYPNINKKSHFLLKEGILGKIDIGKSYQCFLNLNNDKARIFLAIIELNKRDNLLTKNSKFNGIILELFQLGKKFNIETVIMHKKNLIFICHESSKKQDILEHTFLTQEFNIVFLNRHQFQEQFLNNLDLQRYHYILLNTENYVNIISELNDRLITKKLIGQKGQL